MIALEPPVYPSAYCMSDDSFGIELNEHLLNSRLVATAGKMFGSGYGVLPLWRLNESDLEGVVSEVRFDEARRRLLEAASLEKGWDTYDTDPPNAVAVDLATGILGLLEKSQLRPARLLPSSEGGVGISFVDKGRRAEIEIYNSGEMAAVTYGGEQESLAWDLGDGESAITEAIERIRVHLSQ